MTTIRDIYTELEENPEADVLLMIGDTYFSSNFEVFSWRGSYREAAILVEEGEESIKASEVAEKLKEVEGTEVTGWKGGEFILDEESLLFVVSDRGHCGIYDSSDGRDYDCTAISKISFDPDENTYTLYILENMY